MPYVVTTRRPSGHPESLEGYTLHVTRRAVATLEEAQRYVDRAAVEHGYHSDDMGHVVSSSGGTVGPLPDGTTIEVEQISPLMLASRIGASGEEVMSCLRADDFGPLIAAFNARGASGDA